MLLVLLAEEVAAAVEEEVVGLGGDGVEVEEDGVDVVPAPASVAVVVVGGVEAVVGAKAAAGGSEKFGTPPAPPAVEEGGVVVVEVAVAAVGTPTAWPRSRNEADKAEVGGMPAPPIDEESSDRGGVEGETNTAMGALEVKI